MPNTQKRNLNARRILIHGLRVALFVLLLWMIRDASRNLPPPATDFSNSPEALKFVQQSLSAAERIDGNHVHDANGQTIGSILQTSPDSDHIIGYSGPTNCWIVLDENSRIASLMIASSGDTVDHVAAVRSDRQFARSFSGVGFGEADRWQEIDAVSGATLTSYAIIAAVAQRMGGSAPSLKFDAQPGMENVRALFDTADHVVATDRSGLWDVHSNSGKIGQLMTTSPFADQLTGYQGPTMSLVGFDLSGQCTGVVVDQTWENQPYASYLNDDRPFQKLYVGKTMAELSQMAPQDSLIDGVSGATMTSVCVAEGLALAAKSVLRARERSKKGPLRSPVSWWADVLTVLLTGLGILLSFGSFGKYKILRVGFQVAVIIFLGFVNGHMLSQASVVGWAKSGIPLSIAPGLVLLSLAAIVLPIVSKHQPYCHHICPFGAIQQLVKKRLPWQVRIPKSLGRILATIPYALLLLVVVVAIGGWNLSLASIEPFDGFAFRVAGWATIGVFLVGLLASLFSPMAYCRYGCPTGALLGYLRFRADSDRLGVRDWAAGLLLAVAIGLRAGL